MVQAGYVQVSPMSDTDLLETYDSDSGYILVSPASHTDLLLQTNSSSSGYV